MRVEALISTQRIGESNYFLANPYLGISILNGNFWHEVRINKNPEEIEAREAENIWELAYHKCLESLKESK